MKKPVVYLAGPMHKTTDEECHAWRNYVTKELGPKFEIRNPAASEKDLRGSGSELDRLIVDGDKKDIDESNVLLVNWWDGPGIMCGTPMEILYAYDRKKLIVTVADCAKESPWLRYHSTFCYKSTTEALGFLKGWREQYYE
jgi:hypothetical protein